MNEVRLQKVLAQMALRKLDQMLITDPVSIFYLTGKLVLPGERFLGLYLRQDGGHRLFINRLSYAEDLGVEAVQYDDTENPTKIVSAVIDGKKALGVDKNMAARFLLGIMEALPGIFCVNASICVDIPRSVKDTGEQERMREASGRNDQAMGELVSCVKEGITERELTRQLLPIYEGLGASGYSFGPLIGFGKNAAIGHYEGGDVPLKEGDCILVDVGCVWQDYCSDMTRTFFYKNVSPEHRKVYEIVREAQEAAEAAIRPGRPLCEIDQVARDIIEKAGYGQYFTHRLGHFIGLDVHEYGDVSAANQDVAQPGMVFSIEPGIYLPGDVGVRIEDLVLVTETGAEILNKYPKELMVLQ